MLSVEQMCEAIAQHQLMSSRDLAAMKARWFKPDRKDLADAGQFRRWLAANHFLTDLAAGVVAVGRADRLAFNQYKIQDQLGEGPLAGATWPPTRCSGR
jgi:hypothetical protein